MRYLVLAALLATAGGAGCKDPPAPFGRGRDKLAEWATDCDAPLVVEPAPKGPDEMMAGKRFPKIVFAAATNRHVCKPPGWALYVDATERIVGLCVDDRAFRSDGHGGIIPHEKHIDRALPLIAKHVNDTFAQDVAQGQCNFIPDIVPHGLRRWFQRLPSVRGPDGEIRRHPFSGTHAACCWEVIDP